MPEKVLLMMTSQRDVTIWPLHSCLNCHIFRDSGRTLQPIVIKRVHIFSLVPHIGQRILLVNGQITNPEIEKGQILKFP